MTPTQRTAMEQALKALKWSTEYRSGSAIHIDAYVELRTALAEQPAEQEPPIAIVVDAYDTPGLQWLCQAPPSHCPRCG